MILGIVLLLLAVLLAGLLILAALSPDHFRVERSIAVNAPATQLLPLINDFRRWTEWSPWESLDAHLERQYSGNAAGVGAVYEWQGQKAGSGRMEILTSTPELIRIKLDFLKPFVAHNTAEFTIKPQLGYVELNWAMFGPQRFMFRVMSVFFSMDKMVGRDFERGLANLKSLAEKTSHQH